MPNEKHHQWECSFHYSECKNIKISVWEAKKELSQHLQAEGLLHHPDLRPLTLCVCVFNLWDLSKHPSHSRGLTFSLRADSIFTESYLSNDVIVAAKENKRKSKVMSLLSRMHGFRLDMIEKIRANQWSWQGGDKQPLVIQCGQPSASSWVFVFPKTFAQYISF